MSEPSSTVLFLGRFHPLLVHLPIGILVVLALLELLGRHPRHHAARASAGYLLALAAPASIITAFLGWMLSQAGGYDGRLLDLHFWTGLATAVFCSVAAVLFRMRAVKAYRICLGLSLVALVVASHFGGSLTHGSDYLVRYAPKPVRALFGAGAEAAKRPSLEPAAFASLIHPIFDQNCVGCHGPEKSKAGLRVDTVAHLLKGGEGGPGIVPGDAARSEIIEHMRLPIDDDEHMPPEGKPQPSEDEIALIEWWINTGASADTPISKLDQTPNVKRILAKRADNPGANAAKESPRGITREQSLSAAAELSARLNVRIDPLSESGPVVLCNASVAGTGFGDGQLSQLANSEIAPVIENLDLAGTGVSDAGLAVLGRFTSLRRLHLERTQITDQAARCIAALPVLEYLNLYGTKVTDAAIAELGKLPNLKRVYLWETGVTSEGAKKLASARLDDAEKQHLEEQIRKIQERIQNERIFVQLGAPAQTPVTNAVSADSTVTNLVAALPVNAVCPLSGKPVDATKILVHEGATYAFCCDDCLGKAKQDPAGVLAKLKTTK